MLLLRRQIDVYDGRCPEEGGEKAVIPKKIRRKFDVRPSSPNRGQRRNA